MGNADVAAPFTAANYISELHQIRVDIDLTHCCYSRSRHERSLDERIGSRLSARPGVGYRVWRGDEAVEVVLCFSCDELLVLSPKGADGSVHRAAEDFDPARARLVALAKQEFPADQDIQSLNGQR